MTAQFSDLFFYNDKGFSIADFQGDELFHPVTYGMLPKSSCTACWKGFVATYEVQDDILCLKNLDINVEKIRKKYFWSSSIPKLNGEKPFKGESLYNAFDHHFQDANLPLSFTGWILIGDEFIQELYVHMGVHPAWKYKNVIKLVFEKGKLISSLDVSKAMQDYRKKFTNQGEEASTSEDGKEPDSWIEDYLKNQ